MRIGIIDFGTNTLRLNIFETDDDKYAMIYDGTVYSKIVENTINNKLIQDGIEHVIEAIEEHMAVCKHYRCDSIECFSTASLRYIDNASDVLEQVKFRTGIDINMISGDKEALYDFLALKSVIIDNEGTGCDLGGGSLQLFIFNSDGPILSHSFPFGSSRISKQFVKNTIPTNKELDEIHDTISKGIKEYNYKPIGKTLYAMGGTAKATELLLKNMLNKTGNISQTDLKNLLNEITLNPEKSLELFDNIIPSRKRTITPGIEILLSIMETLNLENIKVFTVGVREGFLEEKIKNPSKQDNILNIINSII